MCVSRGIAVACSRKRSQPPHARIRVALCCSLKGLHTALSHLAAAAGYATMGTEENMLVEQLEPFRGCSAWETPEACAPHHQGLTDPLLRRHDGVVIAAVGDRPCEGLLHASCMLNKSREYIPYMDHAHWLKHELLSPCNSMSEQLTCTIYLWCMCFIGISGTAIPPLPTVNSTALPGNGGSSMKGHANIVLH